MDELVERVARGIYNRQREDYSDCWDETTHPNDYLPEARAALAVVADDVDGIAGVLRAHWPTGGQPNWCAACDDEPWTVDHQAAMVAAHIRGGA